MWRWTFYLPAFFLVFANEVRAEIWEWQDEAGSRHFTNLIDEVPSDQRNNPRVIVRETKRTEENESSVSPAPPPVVVPQREALVIYDRSWDSDEYSAGLREGLSLVADRDEPVNVTINGPLSVANSEAYAADADYPVDPYYYPFVTTSFDRGRSRHRTLRMLLQDQFQLDRDGPYLYERINPIGLGPRLQPFLARGLPHRIPPGHRVLFR
jgi:hypothetical protein